ncbi:MAG: formylmethanofuran dehydrogenase subunit B [Candidatus Bathyarchaeota archaeon]|jgi:formylmethanofuran dehydrogenase subunit B|nr:formylmethanofuran dehydrogenase subunit B [Candidatus Bathyarchaeota archaeon A05DMB-3]MDH7606537.1 formylmethanofuran dehydrogenase subunit B [Candidatus Bathyarchaeota archaeon]
MPVVKAVTCPVCGSLCDDIELTIENGRIVKVKNGCAMCEAKFLGYCCEHRVLKPMIRKDGELVKTSLKEAIRRAAEILAEANYPVLYGWSNTSCEATSVGIELAEEVGGVIDNTSVVCHGPSILSIQDVGIPSCTLGQIRHRADLIVYWGSNPWSAHPRHIERYTSFSEGRFEKSAWRGYVTKIKALVGRKKIQSAIKRLVLKKPSQISTHLEPTFVSPIMRKGRKLIVIDVRRTKTAEMADFFVQVEPNKDYELLQAFRALIRDQELAVDKVAGVPVEYLEDVADAMVSCDFGALFFGLGLTMSGAKLRNIDAALSLVRDLNMRTKFIIMPMRGHFNVTGANTVSTWQTGYPYAVDFSLGYPRYNPGETSVVDVLLRKESDAALIVASDPVSNFPHKAAEHLAENPLIVIDPHMNVTAQMADVLIPSAFVGIEAAGTAYRMDHVPIPLKKVVNPPRGILPDEEILRRILAEIRKIKKKQEAA